MSHYLCSYARVGTHISSEASPRSRSLILSPWKRLQMYLSLIMSHKKQSLVDFFALNVVINAFITDCVTQKTVFGQFCRPEYDYKCIYHWLCHTINSLLVNFCRPECMLIMWNKKHFLVDICRPECGYKCIYHWLCHIIKSSVDFCRPECVLKCMRH